MKKNINNLLTAILLFFVAAIAVSAQTEMCFENEGLKANNRISFTLEGNKITDGTFEVIGYDASTSAEVFEFSGTKTGNILKIKFIGTIPYERPPKTKSIVWTLTNNVVKVPTYGKNYTTNRFSTYQASYAKCKIDE